MKCDIITLNTKTFDRNRYISTYNVFEWHIDLFWHVTYRKQMTFQIKINNFFTSYIFLFLAASHTSTFACMQKI